MYSLRNRAAMSRWHKIQHDATSFLDYGSEVYGRLWIQMKGMAWEQRVRRQPIRGPEVHQLEVLNL